MKHLNNYCLFALFACSLTACNNQAAEEAAPKVEKQDAKAPKDQPMAKNTPDENKKAVAEITRFDTTAICQIEDASKEAASKQKSQKVLRKRQAQVQDCYADHSGNPPLKVSLKLSIAEGKVSAVSFDDEAYGKTESAACIQKTAMKWMFFNKCNDEAKIAISVK